MARALAGVGVDCSRRADGVGDGLAPLERGLGLAGSLCGFWDVRGHLVEGLAWLGRLLELPSPSGEGAATSAARVARLRALAAFGYLALAQGDTAAAEAPLAEARALTQTTDDRFGTVWAHMMSGVLALARGETERAAELFEDGLARGYERGDPFWVSGSSFWLGEAARSRGDARRATALYWQALDVAQEHGISWGVSYARGGLARVALAEGDFPRAAALYRETLAFLRRFEDRRNVALALEELGWVIGAQATAAARDRAAEAAVLLGAAAALRERLGLTVILLPGWQASHDAATAAARAALGERFAVAYARGRALSVDEAVELALRGDGPAEQAGPPLAALEDDLTRREREVADLVARGLSTRDIAAALVISERTAEWHVGNLLGKLGLATRAQLATWAAEHPPSG